MSYYSPFQPGSSFVPSGLISPFTSNTLGNLFTTNGNVGINTTSPITNLDINGSLNVSPQFEKKIVRLSLWHSR